jgi:diguanylate cyclase (GGDEF)-like protein/hemerythrin-like metal-binding protein
MREIDAKELETLLDKANAAVLVADLDRSRAVWANPAAAVALGLDHDDMIEGAPFPPAGIDLVAWDALAATVRLEGSASSVELRARQSDGNGRWVLVNAVGVVRREGLLAVCSLADFDEHVNLRLSIQEERERSRREVARLSDELEETRAAAHTDRLTGCWNRLHFDEIVTREIARSDRHGQPLSLAIVDIDFFKRVNDRFGHDEGDAVLKRVVAIVSGKLRASDILVRWGGEEFAVLLPQTALDGAAALAEKLRSAIAGANFGEPGPVTASFGVAEREREEFREAWFKRADLALQRAKNEGRDRVIAWRPGERLPLATVRFAWRDEWASGNETIDSQHRELLEMGNATLDKALSDAPIGEILVSLDRLVGHVAKHFKDEEAILGSLAYPGTGDHARLHDRLVDMALDLKASMLEGRLDRAALFNYLVESVIVGHLLAEDSKFFAYTRPRKP